MSSQAPLRSEALNFGPFARRNRAPGRRCGKRNQECGWRERDSVPIVWVREFVPSGWVLAVSADKSRLFVGTVVVRPFVPVGFAGRERVARGTESGRLEWKAKKQSIRRAQVPGSFRLQVGVGDWTGGVRGVGVG